MRRKNKREGNVSAGADGRVGPEIFNNAAGLVKRFKKFGPKFQMPQRVYRTGKAGEVYFFVTEFMGVQYLGGGIVFAHHKQNGKTLSSELFAKSQARVEMPPRAAGCN